MASTYVNDLRLEEIATGEQSGTWGDTTNTNLELIAEAFSFGTEAITTNADTHTTTIADGATDPGRSMFLKYTGTLDSACTITIAPNTVSKLWFIENGTSGSQNILISQGSGANITIPPGDTKAIYSDGAGSGAAMVDAFASLSVVDLKVQDDLTVTDDMTVGGTLGVTGVLTATSLDISGDIDVDGTTNLDIVDIDGAVNMATTALVTGVLTTTAATVFNGGFASNADSTMGTNKKLIFRDAAIHISSTADGDLSIAADDEIDITSTLIDVNGNLDVSGTALVTGVLTTTAATVFNGGFVSNANSTVNPTGGVITLGANGHITSKQSLDVATAGGRFTGQSNRGDLGKLRIEQTAQGADGGYVALDSAPSGSTTPVERLRVHAAGSTTIKQGGTLFTPLQFDGLIIQNTDATGIRIISDQDNGNVGHAGIGVDNGALTISAAGQISFDTDFRTTDQLYVGRDERFRISTDGSLSTPTLGTSNVRFGVNAGNSIVSGGNYNVCVGDEAGTAISTGDQNTLVGYRAGLDVNTSVNNTAVGMDAMFTNTTGNNNVAVGREALKRLTTSNENVAVGSESLKETTTGTQNVAMGHNAGQQALTADNSVFIGHSAAKGNSGAKLTGNHNVAIGFSAGLLLQGTATENVLVGSYAGDAITTGSENVCMGLGAGGAINTGTRNVCIGDDAGNNITTATRSIAIGHIAMGQSATTGAANIAIGNQAGNSMLAGNFNVLVGEGAGKTINSGIRNTCLGPFSGDAITTAADNVTLGYLAGTYQVDLITGSYNTILGAYCHTSATNSTQQIIMGHNVTGNGDNTLCFGNATTDSSIAFGATSITAPSDQRYKEEIADATAGLSFIKDLRPVTFKWKKEKDVPSDHPAYVEGSDKRVMESNGEINHGFIAQEVKAVIDNHSEIKDGFAMWSEQGLDENGNSTGGRQRLGDGALIPILVKAIQELEARLAVLEG